MAHFIIVPWIADNSKPQSLLVETATGKSGLHVKVDAFCSAAFPRIVSLCISIARACCYIGISDMGSSPQLPAPNAKLKRYRQGRDERAKGAVLLPFFVTGCLRKQWDLTGDATWV